MDFFHAQYHLVFFICKVECNDFEFHFFEIRAFLWWPIVPLLWFVIHLFLFFVDFSQCRQFFLFGWWFENPSVIWVILIFAHWVLQSLHLFLFWAILFLLSNCLPILWFVPFGNYPLLLFDTSCFHHLFHWDSLTWIIWHHYHWWIIFGIRFCIQEHQNFQIGHYLFQFGSEKKVLLICLKNWLFLVLLRNSFFCLVLAGIFAVLMFWLGFCFRFFEYDLHASIYCFLANLEDVL